MNSKPNFVAASPSLISIEIGSSGMQSSTSDDREYFQSLDELNLERNSAAGTKAGTRKSSDATVDRNAAKGVSVSKRKPRENKQRSTAPNPKPATRPPELTDQEVCGILQGSNSAGQREKSAAPASARINQIEDSAVAPARLPTRAAAHFSSSPGPSSISPTRSRITTRFAASIGALGLVVCLGIYAISHHRSDEPQSMSGSIRFQGSAPPAAFIQLLRLNSPREEDFVAEIRDGQFTFPRVPAGDYALWLATADGTPLPVKPVGATVGLLTEAEHHLRISLSSESGPFEFELSAAKTR